MIRPGLAFRSIRARRPLLGSLAAIALLLGGPVAVGPAIDRAVGLVAVGHSQLVSSAPGPGDVLAAPPTEIRLAFSEPIDPRYTSLDLLDGTGATILARVGAADPSDDHVLVAPIPTTIVLPTDTIFTVNWRALSAADGHTTQGFLTFGLGNVAPGAPGQGGTAGASSGSGALHGGHSSGAVAAEIQGKVLGYGGSMLAFGLAILAWLVLRPALGMVPRGAAYGSGIALIAAAAGCLLLVVVGADSVPGSGAAAGGTSDYAGFATGSRVGQLLAARTAIGFLAGVLILAAARFGGRRGIWSGLALGGLAGIVTLGLTAAGGHASAYVSPVPVAMDVVHLASASVWLGGLVLLGALTDFGGKSRLEPGALRRVIPRFSALGLVSVTLIALTGIYADWVQTGDLLGFGTPYGINLLVKIVVSVVALVVGLANYLDGGRDGYGPRFGLSRRLFLELILGVSVLAITANLTSGSPSGADRPVAIAPAVSSAVSTEPTTLGLLPGRSGPDRLVVGLANAPSRGTLVELVLQRLDLEAGISRLPLRPDLTAARPTFVADTTFPAGSRWDATVVATDAGGTELARQRFVFALDALGLSEGRDAPPLDPGLVVAVLLLVLGVLGLGFALAGGVLPRTLPDASRPAMIGASLTGLALGVATLVLGGPR